MRFGPDGNLAGQPERRTVGCIRGCGDSLRHQQQRRVLSYASARIKRWRKRFAADGLGVRHGATNENTLYVSNSGGQNVYQITHADKRDADGDAFIAKNTAVLNYPSGWCGARTATCTCDQMATNGKGQILQYSTSGVFQEVSVPPRAAGRMRSRPTRCSCPTAAGRPTWVCRRRVSEGLDLGVYRDRHVGDVCAATAFPAGAGGVTDRPDAVDPQRRNQRRRQEPQAGTITIDS